MALNLIGPFRFISIEGHADPLKEDVELIMRQGVRGLAAWLTADRGHPFKVRTKVDAASKAAARAAVLAYKALIGANPVTVTWSDIVLGGENTRFLVLNVTAIDVRRIVNSSGGLNPPSLGWIEAEWELVAIEIPAA